MKTIFTISNVEIIALLLLECAMSTKIVNKAPKVGITVRSEGHLSSRRPARDFFSPVYTVYFTVYRNVKFY